jgi:hypothetical protein
MKSSAGIFGLAALIIKEKERRLASSLSPTGSFIQ